MAKVELQNVTKIYDKTIKALDDVSFTVKDGEFFVLLGPTGAGKTTMLRSVAGLEKIDKGKILFQKSIPILDKDTVSSLSSRIHKLEYKFFPQIIEKYILNKL